MLRKLSSYVGDCAVQIDADTGARNLRKECPKLLLEDEGVLFAFKDRGGLGRDESYFTTHRVLIRDAKNITGHKVKYMSIPYSSVKTFTVESAGNITDSDCTLRIMSSGVGTTSMAFAAKADMVGLVRHLNRMILDGGAVAMGAVPGATGDGKAGGGVLAWLGDAAPPIDAASAERQLRSDPRVLLDGETVEMAVKCGRNALVFTSKRLLVIIVKATMTGSQVEYLTVPWKCLRGFSVETSGTSSSVDSDSELTLFTSISDLPRVQQEVRKGEIDLIAVQKLVADKLLGTDSSVTAAKDYSQILPSPWGVLSLLGVKGGEQRLFATDDDPVSPASEQIVTPTSTGSPALLGIPTNPTSPTSPTAPATPGANSRKMFAIEADKRFHSNPLQAGEHVDVEIKGRKKMTLFTSKRLLLVDVNTSDKKVNYISIPWTTVQVFGFYLPGSWIKKDTELRIWTDINDVYSPPKDDTGNLSRDEPGNSYIVIDLQKDKVDVMKLHRYLSARCLHTARGELLPSEVLAASPDRAVDKLMDWAVATTNDTCDLDTAELDRQLHTDEIRLLPSDERVAMAWKNGRDLLVFTTRRVLFVDVQGMQGAKVEWKSVPYTSLRAFAVESASSWAREAEVRLFGSIFWSDGRPGSMMKQDLRKNRADVVAIQSFLAARIFGTEDVSAAAAATQGGFLERFGIGTAGGLLERFGIGTADSSTATEMTETATTTSTSSPSSTGRSVRFNNFLSWIGDDAKEMNREEVDTTLHTSPAILQSDESVNLCFKAGRKTYVFTTKRVLEVDVQIVTGKTVSSPSKVSTPSRDSSKSKVECTSYPLKSCAAFAVSSAGEVSSLSSVMGSFVGDAASATVFRDVAGAAKQKLDVPSKVDIWTIQSFWAEKLLSRS